MGLSIGDTSEKEFITTGGVMYKLVIKCAVCHQVLGIKPTDRKEDDGHFSHTFCIPCAKEYYRQNGLEFTEEDELECK